MSTTEPLSRHNSTTSGQLDYKPSKIIAIFLIKFDVKYGYKLVWSKQSDSKASINLDGLDYKVFPSGLQEHESNTVLISHKDGDTIYYGLGRFRQKAINSDESNQINRDNVHMYSIGILCEPTVNLAWKSNEFLSNGWEHINNLDEALLKFINAGDYNNFTVFEDIFNNVDNNHLRVGNTSGPINNHPLNKLPLMFQSLGPLVFTLYKQALLRKNILIFHQNHSKLDNFSLGSFTYLLSLLSVVPADTERYNDTILYSQPIYSIGLNDLGTSLMASRAAIATTNDDILMYQKGVYDYAVFLPNGEYNNTFILKADTLVNDIKNPLDCMNQRVKATRKDYHKFKLVFKQLSTKNRGNMSTDDLASIKTTNSNISSRGWGSGLSKDDTFLEGEPSWWLDLATSPISWREYIWSAFSWFASAGTVSEDSNPLETNDEQPTKSLNNECPVLNEEDSKRNLIQLVDIVGQFHKLTKKWFHLINEIVLEETENHQSHALDNNREDQDLLLNRENNPDKVNIEMTYQDIIDMELDPYSEQDLHFVKEFILLYWGSSVDSVEIGIGLNGICC